MYITLLFLIVLVGGVIFLVGPVMDIVLIIMFRSAFLGDPMKIPIYLKIIIFCWGSLLITLGIKIFV
jgi:hypothetical protein